MFSYNCIPWVQNSVGIHISTVLKEYWIAGAPSPETRGCWRLRKTKWNSYLETTMTALHERGPQGRRRTAESFPIRFTAWWGAPRETPGRSRLSYLGKHSSVSNRCPVFGRLVRCLHNSAVVALWSSMVILLTTFSSGKSLCDSKNDIFMATPGSFPLKRGRPDLGSKKRWRPFKEEKSDI